VRVAGLMYDGFLIEVEVIAVLNTTSEGSTPAALL
jgi:hypothetical protein